LSFSSKARRNVGLKKTDWRKSRDAATRSNSKGLAALKDPRYKKMRGEEKGGEHMPLTGQPCGERLWEIEKPTIASKRRTSQGVQTSSSTRSIKTKISLKSGLLGGKVRIIYHPSLSIGVGSEEIIHGRVEEGICKTGKGRIGGLTDVSLHFLRERHN